MTVYDITKTTIDVKALKTGDIINCPYSGSMKSIDLPKGQYKFEVWGGMGGAYSSSAIAGKGGYSVGTIDLSSNLMTYLYAGGQGSNANTSGGFNGGGKCNNYGGSGGGGSDVRLGTDSLYTRVIVAGGGGGTGYSSIGGGSGGGLTGENGGTGTYSGGYGATQTSGGTNNTQGIFGSAQANASSGGGGGGGWYGGSSGTSGETDSGAGGGSGYIYTSSSATSYPSGCLLNASHYLSNANTIGGISTMPLPSGSTSTGNASTGYVRITILNIATTSMFVKINGEWKGVSGVSVKTNNIWS